MKESDYRFDELGDEIDLDFELDDLQDTLKMVGNSIDHAIKVENDIKKEAMMFELELCGGQLDDFECTLEDLEKEIIAERKLMKE